MILAPAPRLQLLMNGDQDALRSPLVSCVPQFYRAARSVPLHDLGNQPHPIRSSVSVPGTGVDHHRAFGDNDRRVLKGVGLQALRGFQGRRGSFAGEGGRE